MWVGQWCILFVVIGQPSIDSLHNVDKKIPLTVQFVSNTCGLILCQTNHTSEWCFQGLFQQFWEKAPGINWEKMIDFTSKLGEINDIEHY